MSESPRVLREQSDISPTAVDFVLKMENRNFIIRLIAATLGYLLITLWLNNVRTQWSAWTVWVLIIIQIFLYIAIFFSSYQRAKVIGLGSFLNTCVIIVAVLGRVSNWEVVIIPLCVVVMIFLSLKNKNISVKARFLLSNR